MHVLHVYKRSWFNYCSASVLLNHETHEIIDSIYYLNVILTDAAMLYMKCQFKK